MEIGELQKNSMEKIKVVITDFEGHKFIDIRAYYENDSSEWKPTKKGITVPPDKFEEFFKLLQRVQKELKKSSQQNERKNRQARQA